MDSETSARTERYSSRFIESCRAELDTKVKLESAILDLPGHTVFKSPELQLVSCRSSAYRLIEKDLRPVSFIRRIQDLKRIRS